MCIYCHTKYYRKIYESHHGKIPKDHNNRSFEIHHIDGDHSNNDPANLKAVSIEEHYNIHYNQGDYKACLLISRSMNVSPEEKSKLASIAAKQAVQNGTHPWLGDKNPQRKACAKGEGTFQDPIWQKEKARRQVENGTHNFLGRKVQKNRLENGTHHFLGETNPSTKRSKDGTHSWIGGDHARQLNKRLLESGTHSTQWNWVCECGKEGKGKSNLGQHKRGTKCSLNKN
jgi:hypothetical protein